MKTIKLFLTVAVAATLAAGCATSGYEKGNKTAGNVQKAADQIGALTANVDSTLTALNDLVNNPKPDLRPQFKTFDSSLKSLESDAKSLEKARMSMGSEGKEFFAKWDEQIAQINNEDIKARSQSRKAEVFEKLQTIKRSYAEAEVAFKPFMSELRDVQKFLSVDLTKGGLSAINSSVTKATQSSVALKQALGKLAADFKSVGVAMSAVAPAPPAAK